MNFAKYGNPSTEWREFVAKVPSVANEGFTGNDPSQAAQLQKFVNTTRETAGTELLAATNLQSRLDISSMTVPSRHGHQIPLRSYSPKSQQSAAEHALLVYFHGGGFLFGTEATEDFLCAEIAADVGLTVLSVNYSHTPEYTHPTAHDDALDVYDFIQKNLSAAPFEKTSDIVVLGISAGASLAAEFVQHDVDLSKLDSSHKPLISGAVLSVPWLIHVENTPSHLYETPEVASSVQCRHAPVIPWPRLKLFSDLLAAKDVTDPRLNSALRPDSELQGWPRTGFIIAGMDPLRDDGLIMAQRLEVLGTEISVHIFPGVPHGFRRWQNLRCAKESDEKTVDLIRWMLKLGETHDSPIRGWHEYNG